jgi:hypothetical protein
MGEDNTATQSEGGLPVVGSGGSLMIHSAGSVTNQCTVYINHSFM